MKAITILIIILCLFTGCNEDEFTIAIAENDKIEALNTVKIIEIIDGESFTCETETGIVLDSDNPDMVTLSIGDRALISIVFESEPGESEWFITVVTLIKKI